MKLTPDEALEKFWDCIVAATKAANAKHGFGGVPFRREVGGKHFMGVRYPDGHEDVYEVGAEWMN